MLPNCMNNPVGHVRQTTKELSLAFVILFAGALSAVVMLIAEYVLTTVFGTSLKRYRTGSSLSSTVTSQSATVVTVHSASAKQHMSL